MVNNIESCINQPKALEPMGFFIPPREIEIQSIPTIIVDPHNEALPFWMKNQGNSVLLIHIDNHPDMHYGAQTFKQAKKITTWRQINDISDYARNYLNVGNFIAAAVNQDKVGGIYWYDPRKDYVKAYGRAKKDGFDNQPATVVNAEGRIRWKNGGMEPLQENISLKLALEDNQKFNGSIILDIDLDAFLCTKDPVGQNPDILFERLEKTKTFIKLLNKKPDIISIARSQTPTLWTPSDRVNEIQALTIEMLSEVL